MVRAAFLTFLIVAIAVVGVSTVLSWPGHASAVVAAVAALCGLLPSPCRLTAAGRPAEGAMKAQRPPAD